jgi:hypothetical protein
MRRVGFNRPAFSPVLFFTFLRHRYVTIIKYVTILLMITAAAGAAGDEWAVVAARVDEPPTIDGKWEEIWFRAAPAGGFRQYRPQLGAAPEKRTEVYVLYDDDALYVGWICYEDAPTRLVASASVRDMFMNNDDCIDLMLDANDDRQSAYDFMVNWRGVKYDGSFARDGQVGGPAWDGYWEAATSVGGDAWYCEMAIPWATLRYDRDAASLGIQFLRMRRATFEESFWASDGDILNRVSTFGRLEGVRDLPPPEPFKVTPYVTGRGEELRETRYYGYEPTDGWEFRPRYGGDVEYRAGAAATVLATVLPDYAYIEADPAEINLQPTEIYLEEKRPFFTEGYEFFANDFLYTRRFTDIAGGFKATGRWGRMSYGALDVKLLEDDPRFPGDNFGMAKVSYDVAGGSSFAVAGMGRRELGGEIPPAEGAGEDRARYNNVGLAEGHVALPQLALYHNYYRAETAGDGGDGYDYYVSLSRPLLTEYVQAWYGEISGDFRADMSFLQPEDLDTRTAGGWAQKEVQVNRGGWRSVLASCYYEHGWNLRGESKRNELSPVLRLASENDYFVTFNYRGGRDSRYIPFGYPDFRNNVFDVAAGHSPASWGRFRLGYWRGTYYGDFYHYYTLELDVVPTPPLVFNYNLDVGNRRPAERFFVGNLKVTHNLTDSLFWRLILQGNSDARTSQASVLGGWEFRPGSTAYLAYEQQRDSNGPFLLAEQLLFAKVSYMIPL